MKPRNYIKVVASFKDGNYIMENPQGSLVKPNLVLKQLAQDYELNETRGVFNPKKNRYEDVKLQEMESLYIEFIKK
ncbi:hypothetical protein ACERII_18065 [Evansella sp. AB-rgal1]|uniref:hypothetical protein n=1 Tax=Evansella sp. AB-rgal1 TaxID=3242696 RepID=UPI00359CC51B